MADDLGLLGVGPSDRKKLEAMGFTTLEQIVLLDRYALGLGKEKGDALVQRAANILCNHHIKDITAEENRVTVQVDRVSEAIVAAVKEVLGSYGSEYSVQENRTIIVTPARSPHSGDFHYVVKNARRRQEVSAAKRRDELQREGITLSQPELLEFARERGFEGFAKNVLGVIKGNELMKRAITAAMFSTFQQPVHVLVVGEPGSGKSMAREIIIENFKEITPIGANSTRAGLVCNRSTGESGALAYSDKKLVIIDEFDKLPDEDVQYCYELLSNGKCNVDSGRIHATIESHFIAVAFANPRGEVFRGRPMEQLGFPPTLLSRFALVVPSEMLGRDMVKELMAKKLRGTSDFYELPQYYDQWVKLARLHQPAIKTSDKSFDRYIDEGADLYERYSGTPLRRDQRLADYLARVPRSIARSEFSDVCDETLNRALTLIKESIKAWD